MNNKETVNGVVKLHFGRDDIERLLRVEAMRELGLKSDEGLRLRVVFTTDAVLNSIVEIDEDALK